MTNCIVGKKIGAVGSGHLELFPFVVLPICVCVNIYFVSKISQELLYLETWNLVHMTSMTSCIVGKKILNRKSLILRFQELFSNQVSDLGPVVFWLIFSCWTIWSISALCKSKNEKFRECHNQKVPRGRKPKGQRNKQHNTNGQTSKWFGLFFPTRRHQMPKHWNHVITDGHGRGF